MPDHWEIAYEQYLFWRRQGLTHAEMLAAFGYAKPPEKLSARIVVDCLAAEHRELMRVMLLGEAA